MAVTQQTDNITDPVSQIVETLRQEIVAGTLPPDAPVRQEQLAARFGISRMPIREAIKQLQNLGFITVGPNKRACVAPMNRSDFLDIYDMRIALETLVLIVNAFNMYLDRA